MPDLAVSAASTDVCKLPPLLNKEQACEFLGVSERTLDRRLADGVIFFTRVGRSKSSPVRIPRDRLLRDLGLVSPAEGQRRDRRRADAEWRIAVARLGLDGDDERDEGVRA